MNKVPSLNYDKVIKALQRNGWVVVRQKGAHIRLQKHLFDEVLKLTVPAHKPIKRSTLSHIIKRSTLSHILKQARISVEQFNKSL